MNCPLCLQTDPVVFHIDTFRTYYRCPHCLLIFVDSKYLPSSKEEKDRYQLHNNDSDEQGYVEFLYTFIRPLNKRITKKSKGLDYGSGPTPVLANLLSAEGYTISIFDPFFAGDTKVLSKKYDYLTCVETAEHFHRPAQDWKTMIQLVKKGGWLGVKTTMYSEHINFSSWHYKRDNTHVCFYAQETFRWIAKKYALEMHVEDESTVFFKVRTSSSVLEFIDL